jgi:hypothetical protein
MLSLTRFRDPKEAILTLKMHTPPVTTEFGAFSQQPMKG